MAVGDIYSVQYEVAQQGLSYTYTNIYRVKAGSPGNDGTQGLGQVTTGPGQALRDILADDSQVGCSVTRAVLPNDAAPWLETFPSYVGTNGTSGLPYNSTGIVQIRTEAPGGRHDGIIQISGLPESATALGRLTDAFRTGLGLAFLDSFEELTDGNGNVYELGVLTRQAGGVPVDPPTFSKFVNIVWNPELRSRRTRTSKLTGSVN